VAAARRAPLGGWRVIGAVNSALLEIQGALLARSLYPDAHPRIRASEERAEALLHDVLEQRPEIKLFAIGDRVIFDNEILPGSASLVDTLFRMLHIKGVDQLIVRRGIDTAEIGGFLDVLSAGDRSDAPPLRSTAHLGFASLKAADAAAAPGSPMRSNVLAYAEEASDVLPGIWQGLAAERRVDMNLLGDIVACVGKVVSDSSGAMLPLAPLKRHDEYTFVHTINVALLSTALSEALGFDGHEAHEVSISALLHDVGKTAIPEEILKKTTRFTEEEFAIMQLHPIEGARILFNTPGIPELAPIVAYEHHVRANGGGYPRVPKNWRLSLGSRVVQLADVFDALRTHRPYRPGLPVPKIVEVMRNDVGTFFDADLLEIFLQRVVARGIPDQVPTTV